MRTAPILLLGLVLPSLLQSGAVVAAERVYRWVDGNGQVHYAGQRPATGPYEVIEKSAGGPASGAENDAGDVKKFLQNAEAANKATAEEKSRRQAVQAEAQAACDQARRRLAFLDERTARRLAVENPDGTVARMDDTEFEQRRAATRKNIDAHCR